MKDQVSSFVTRGMAGAVWGSAAGILAYILGIWLPVFPLLYYPLLFAGAAPLALMFSGNSINLRQAVFTGAVSGLIYLILSPVFPLFAAVLAGASLGGGLSQNTEKPLGLLGHILNTLKGAVLLPLLILTGSVAGGLISEAALYQWIFWGFWTTFGLGFIIGSNRKRVEHSGNIKNRSALGEFKSQARDISRELSELNNRIDI